MPATRRRYACNRIANRLNPNCARFEPEETSYLSLEEIRNEIHAFSDDDYLKLRMIAKYWVDFCELRPNFDEGDLVSETILRAWSGTRNCRRNRFMWYLGRYVMRSVAFQWRNAKFRLGEEELSEEKALIDEGRGSVEEQLVTLETYLELLAKFSDSHERNMFLGKIDGLEGEELRKFTGLQGTAFKSARDTVKRKIRAYRKEDRHT